jgi:truncated hemoglobin YjbI
MIQQNNPDTVVHGAPRLQKKSGLAYGEGGTTLFHQLGGYVLLEEAIYVFYEKILADPRTNYFFRGNDTRLQRARMKSFLAKLLAVPIVYGSFEMDRTSPLFIKSGMVHDHFIIVTNHLRQSFLDLAVNASLVDEVMALIIIASRKDGTFKKLNP